MSILLKVIAWLFTKERLKSMAGSILDRAAQEVVEMTPDDIGAVTLDQAVVLIKDRIKNAIDYI